jgi:putative ABC transport system permease protein
VVNLRRRANLRHLRRHPWQLFLAIAGVALGVAVVVAVDLANESAQRGFALSMDELTGRASHQIVGGPAGLDERLFVRLRREAAGIAAAPVLETYATLMGETVRLLGVDPFSERRFRDQLDGTGEGVLSGLLTDRRAVLLAEPTATRLGVVVGDPLILSLDGRDHRVRVAGLIHAGAEAAAIDGLLVADIATAQELSNQIGRLTRIDLVLPPGAAGRAVVERLHGLLPPAAELLTADSRSRAMAQMSRAFRTNLTAMSLLALVVGMFLIYNTMTFTVLQRRALLGTLRILGVTRAELLGIVLGEALLIGLAGTVFGILTGVFLGQGLVRLVTRTINDHYYVLTVSTYLVTATPLLTGAVLGVGATVLATLAPAFEAAGTAPAAALHRSRLEQRTHRLAPRLALLGLLMVVLALALLALTTRSMLLGFAALFLLIVGLALISPYAVLLMSRLATPAFGRLFGLKARLAIRGIGAGLSRTGTAIAALMLAVATIVGVGVMVESFRATVDLWLQATLRADIYVSLPGVGAARPRGTLDPALVERIRAVPGIAGVSTGRRVGVHSGEATTAVFALGLPEGMLPRYPLKAGHPAAAWQSFRAATAVLISEPLAWHRGLRVGDTITLRTDRGPRTYPIAGVYYDYGSEQGEVLMPRALYDRDFDDRGLTALGLYLMEGADRERVMAGLRHVVGEAKSAQHPLVRANQEIRELSLAIFDRTFTITRVLRVLAILVAFFGILSAFMALALERGKELAVLRATGLTPGETGRLVALQTAAMGLAAGLLALPTGLALAEVLVHVINRRSFGWSMQTLLPAAILVQAVLLALGAALLAGLYPGWKMARTSPAEALREE